MKRFFIGFAILVSVLLASAAGVLTWTFQNPEKAWRLAEAYILPKDLKIRWQEIEFRPVWKAWNRFDFQWRAQGLSIQKQDPQVSMLLNDAATDFELTAFSSGPWLAVRQLRVNATEPVIVKPSPSPEREVKSYFQQLQSGIELLEQISRAGVLQDLQVSLREVRILNESGAEPVKFGISIERSIENQNLVGFEFKIRDLAEPHVSSLNLKGQIDFSQFGQAHSFLKAELSIEGKGLAAKGPVSLRYADARARLISQIDWHYLLDKKRLEGSSNLEIGFDATLLSLKLYTDLQGLPGPLPIIQGARASLDIPMQDGVLWSEVGSDIKVWAPVSILPLMQKSLRRSIEKSCRCKTPSHLMVTFSGKAWPGHLLQPKRERRSIADLKLNIETVRNKLFLVDLNGTVKIERDQKRWHFTPFLDSRFKAFSYQALRQFVDARDLMIPAPFDVLEGQIELTAHGPVEISYREDRILEWEFPAGLTTDLVSKNQQVKLKVDAAVQTSADFKKIHFEIKSRIEKFRVELPPLDPLRGLPQMVRDPRILMKAVPKVRTKGSEISFDINVETAQPGSIQLLYGLADPYVPVTLKFQSEGKNKAAGFVQVEAFKLKYLRRALDIQRVRVNLDPTEDGGFPLDGDLKMAQTDYQIAIKLAGTTARPQIQLSSDPYLSRNDIISVILYDRTSDQLVSADAETAGGVEAAMADRAIGLVGLYAFSTTPIRNFSYNSVTKVYTATVQVADGLTAGVGSDLENAAHLEVRKRVSRRWVLTASWNPSGPQDEAGKVVLQWERRF